MQITKTENIISGFRMIVSDVFAFRALQRPHSSPRRRLLRLLRVDRAEHSRALIRLLLYNQIKQFLLPLTLAGERGRAQRRASRKITMNDLGRVAEFSGKQWRQRNSVKDPRVRTQLIKHRTESRRKWELSLRPGDSGRDELTSETCRSCTTHNAAAYRSVSNTRLLKS